MKRLVAFVFAGAVGSVIAGCPIYSDNGDAWCASYHDCKPGEDCFQWPCNARSTYGGSAGAYYFGGGAGYSAVGGRGGSDAGGRDGGDAAVQDARPDTVPAEAAQPEAAQPDATQPEAASLTACANPGDCGGGFTCGPDGACHPGDCSTTPCINGFVCETSASGQACAKVDPLSCGSDDECAGSGACVDGVCTAAGSLCSDRTQCRSAELCVEGKCIATCGDDGSCPAGFICDQKRSRLCNIGQKGCVVTADCGGQYTVCVNNVCVPRCTVRGPCGDGLGTCVNNGCVPSQKIVAQCVGEGVQGGCSSGQICVHQHCYVSCAIPDGGVGAACTGPDEDVCKTVTTAGGTYAVCGSTSNLGTECDRTTGKRCPTGRVCIDGFCK